MHVNVLTHLFDSFVMGQDVPLHDELFTTRQPHRLRRGASGRVELREHRNSPTLLMASER